MEKPLTSIDLSDEDALLFIQFRKRQAFIEMVESVGGFDIKNGSLTIHFNEYGGAPVMEVNKRYKLSPGA